MYDSSDLECADKNSQTRGSPYRGGAAGPGARESAREAMSSWKFKPQTKVPEGTEVGRIVYLFFVGEYAELPASD